MSGWAVPLEFTGQEHEKNNKRQLNLAESIPYRSLQHEEKEVDAGSEIDEDMNNDVPNDRYHNMQASNGLKQTTRQISDDSTIRTERVFQQQVAAESQAVLSQSRLVGCKTSAQSSAASRSNTSLSTCANSTMMIGNDKIKKAYKHVPSSESPYFSFQARPSSGMTPQNESHGSFDAANKYGRIGKRAAANLVADQVLNVRLYGKAKEYLICWQGLSTPLWIAHRKCAPQAKEMIEAYTANLRRQNRASGISKRGRGASPIGQKKLATYGANVHDAARGDGAGETPFYIVDHIVKHRTHYNKRQYLVRWENYSESEDTWEHADKLRADVPDIVNAYEEKLQRDDVQADTVSSAMSKIPSDTMEGRETTTTATTQREDAGATARIISSVDRDTSEQSVQKRRRIITEDAEKCSGDADDDHRSKDDALTAETVEV